MRCGFDTYRAFHQDAEENQELLKKGKCKVPAQSLNGEASFLAGIAESMIRKMYENWRCSTVVGSEHWCAEENPGRLLRHPYVLLTSADDFVKILDFVSTT
jgi:hypothetical protein